MTTYSKETALYNTGGIATDIEEAGTKASSYFTDITSGGVFVHEQDPNNPDPEDESSNGVLITDRIDIIRGGDSVAYFGENSVIGKLNSQRLEVNDDSMVAYNADSSPYFKVDYDSGTATYEVVNNYSVNDTNILQPAVSWIKGQPFLDKNIINSSKSWAPSDVLSSYPVPKDCFTFSFFIESTLGTSHIPSYIKSYTGTKFQLNKVPISNNRYKLVFTNLMSFAISTTETSGAMTLVSSDEGNKGTLAWKCWLQSGTLRIRVSYLPTLMDSNLYCDGATYFRLRTRFNTTVTTTAPSYSLGFRTPETTEGSFSAAIGQQITAAGPHQVAIGKYNNNSTSNAFEIGAGTSSSRSNALSVDWSGNVNIKSGAKYKINGTALSASDVGAVPTTRTVNSKALSSDISLTSSDVGAVPTTRKVNSKALSSDITLSASDVSAVPTTRKVNSKALSSDITLSASDVSAVPTTRKVNSKALSSDITLSASDVSAVPTTRKVNSKALSSDITLSASDVSAVPTTRTVNSKALSSDITLSASDVGAADSTEFNKQASNHLVIGGYHVCWGSLTVSSPTLNAYAEQTVTLPYTYTSTPFCIASCAGRAARHRTAYASQGDQTGNKIRVGYYATASGAIYINYLTIGV